MAGWSQLPNHDLSYLPLNQVLQKTIPQVKQHFLYGDLLGYNTWTDRYISHLWRLHREHLFQILTEHPNKITAAYVTTILLVFLRMLPPGDGSLQGFYKYESYFTTTTKSRVRIITTEGITYTIRIKHTKTDSGVAAS